MKGLTRPSYMPKYRPLAGDGCRLWLPGQTDAYSSVIKDYSGYNNHGTITGATFERLPSGLMVNSFDGVDDYLDCGTDSSLNPGTSDFTILLWHKRNGTPGVYDALYSKNDIDSADLNGFIVWVTNAYRIRIDIGSGAGSRIITNTDDTVPTTYSLISIVFDRDGNEQLYINATSVHTADISSLNGNNITNNSSFLLGKTTGDNRTDGANIGLARYLKSALSTSQIAGIFNSERHLFNV